MKRHSAGGILSLHSRRVRTNSLVRTWETELASRGVLDEGMLEVAWMEDHAMDLIQRPRGERLGEQLRCLPALARRLLSIAPLADMLRSDIDFRNSLADLPKI